MTLSDPLLKELKGHIAKLVLGNPPPYGDENETVFLLCHCIESIFLKGLIRHDGFTPWRADCFSWFYQLVRKYHRVVPLSFKLAFEEVLNDTKTRSQTGKLRLLIRTCLKRRCLYIPLQFHVENEDYGDSNLRVNYHKDGSILGHEILSQIFLSLIQQLSHYEFNFDLCNSSFLDESWQIPQIVKAEFVPCDRLGLTLGFPLGFAVIVEIIDHSLAAEVSGTIAVGDIMDEFNGTAVRNFYGSKIDSLFRKHRSRPFTISFIKATDSQGQLYLPAIKLYRILGLDPEKLTYSKAISSSHDDDQDEIDLEHTNNAEAERATNNKILNKGECETLNNRPSDNNSPLIEDLIQDGDDENPSKNTLHYQNIMDDLVLSSNSTLEPQESLIPHPLNCNSDLNDIDLSSPETAAASEINWENLIPSKLPLQENCENFVNSEIMGESLLQLDNEKLSQPNQGSGTSSAFQSKYAENNENPYMV